MAKGRHIGTRRDGLFSLLDRDGNAEAKALSLQPANSHTPYALSSVTPTSWAKQEFHAPRPDKAGHRKATYAWAMFFKEQMKRINDRIKHYHQISNMLEKEDVAAGTNHLGNQLIEIAADLRKEIECPVCFDALKINGFNNQVLCGHLVCKECAAKIKPYKCPICRHR